jgi:hypothetical protein
MLLLGAQVLVQDNLKTDNTHRSFFSLCVFVYILRSCELCAYLEKQNF